jgi:hypothetical protein
MTLVVVDHFPWKNRLATERRAVSTESLLHSRARTRKGFIVQLNLFPTILKRTIQRVRQKKEVAPANPSNFEFVIPDQYRYNSNGEFFLKFDSGLTESRILIFTTRQNLDFMNECDNWFCYGTFSVASPIFTQLYTIHGVCYSNVIPSVYILLPH